jgi:hypothetical protein
MTEEAIQNFRASRGSLSVQQIFRTGIPHILGYNPVLDIPFQQCQQLFDSFGFGGKPASLASFTQASPLEIQ